METKGKILIVDDNEDVLLALNLLLEPHVEKVKVTTQPSRIEHFMTTFEPDVILLDMNFRRDAISGEEGFDCYDFTKISNFFCIECAIPHKKCAIPHTFHFCYF